MNEIEVVASYRYPTFDLNVLDEFKAAGYDTVCFSCFEEQQVVETMIRCGNVGLRSLFAPVNLKQAQMLKSVGVDRLKIDSALIPQVELLDGIASLQLSVIISTGACTFFEMRQAIGCFPSSQRIVMHCVEGHPVGLADMNLLILKIIRGNFRGAIGLTDTTRGSIAALIALGIGARTFEKRVQLNPIRSNYVADLKAGAEALGSDHKLVLPVEAEAHNLFKQMREVGVT